MTTKTTTSATRMRKRTSRWVRPAGLAILTLATILGAATGVFAAPVAAAPNAGPPTTTKVPKPRTVEGIVRSKSGAPIQGAVVYLKDTRSLAVKSYLSDPDGHFHFRQLSLSTDYDLWAELKGKRSKTKSISQFNSKPDLHYTLKVDTAK